MAEARRQTRWSRRGAVATFIGVLVACVAIAVTVSGSRSGSDPEDVPVGTLVVVHADDVGGVGLLAVAGGTHPVAYLTDGSQLYIDCLQPVDPNYLLAHISDGAYTDRWIDALRLSTIRNEDVRYIEPPFPLCGASVPLGTSTSMP